MVVRIFLVNSVQLVAHFVLDVAHFVHLVEQEPPLYLAFSIVMNFSNIFEIIFKTVVEGTGEEY